MKSFNEMWKELGKKYLNVSRGMDQGFESGKYTKLFAKYCKQVEAIDASQYWYDIAKENLKNYKNVTLHVMDAKKLKFANKYFDVVLNTSFHEFDLFDLHDTEFKMDLNLKTQMLNEMMRVSNTIVFAEISPDNISGELYKVFNPFEDHCQRVARSNELADKVLKANGYKRVFLDYAADEIIYNSKEEFLEDMLDWWKEIKVPASAKEKVKMKKQIENILETENMLSNLCFRDVFRFAVYQKPNKK